MHTRFPRSLIVLSVALAAVVSASSAAADQKAAEAAWNRGETAKAAELYEQVLSTDPDNREALLRTAQVLSSKHKYTEALARYERVLVKNPDDVDARLGKGGALVSLGVNYEARPLLERLSREYPKRMEPRLNLAWMDLFSSPPDAMPNVRALEAQFPADEGVKALGKVSRMLSAPTVSLSQGRSTDNGDNETAITQVEAQVTGAETQFKFSAGRAKITSPGVGAEANISAFEAGISRDLRGGHRLTLKGGVESQEGRKETNTYPVFGANWQFGGQARLSGKVGIEREPIRYAVDFVDSQIRVDKFTTSLSYKASRMVTISADGLIGRVSSLAGDADRYGGSVSLQRKLLLGGRVPIDAGYQFSYTDHSRNLQNGYWMPSNQKSHSLFARSFVYFPSGFAYFASIQVGRSDFNVDFKPTPITVKGDVSVSAVVALTVPLMKLPFSLELLGVRSAGSLEQTNGFTATTLGARLVWKGGSR